MRVNPSVVYHFESKAEERLFLKFNNIELEEGTAFHSLNIPKHEKKQYAEADFVVLSVHGVLVLEVKGGRISVRDGDWYTENRNGDVSRLKESPVSQVTSAKEALVNLLLEKDLGFDVTKINFGFGVMFPDVKAGDLGVELTKEMVFDAIDMDRDHLKRWLEKLYKYWAERKKIRGKLSSEQVAQLKNALRPEFDKGRSLLAEVDTAWQSLIALTEHQYAAVDTILDNKKVVVKGGAGTGKTLVAIRAAEELDQQRVKVLFLCRNPVLASFLKARLRRTEVLVLDFLAFRERIESGTLQSFDALIVDEGQDMLDMTSIGLLDEAILGGFVDGRWYFFTDPNNQGALYADIEAEALDYLRECSASVPLSRNCRNTRQIALQTLLYTGGDIGRGSIDSEGVPVKTKGLKFSTTGELASLIENQLSEWIDDESVKPGDITILSPLPFEESVVTMIDRRWRRKITVINESFGERWPDTQLAYSTIRDFKGLENKYVMLVDTDKLVESTNSINQLYVAMTRANVLLWLPISDQARSWFDSNMEKNQLRAMKFLESYK
ncbi:NERD domain-containing protein [uncultured Pseudomonas sp.]|uniref:nuclease-related domain-containing DEAD/DEAH box helicase n=1 Tax=uncultured Pseudomonas sp. TaxID=114707 RepID=UPI0030D87E4B|tara:strand:- start:4752 stop:6407 length:1656 start_codon:yes stop_codon:yes gene_type:complete